MKKSNDRIYINHVFIDYSEILEMIAKMHAEKIIFTEKTKMKYSLCSVKLEER